MSRSFRLAPAALAGLLAMGAAPAQAQSCAGAPQWSAGPRVHSDILKAAAEGRVLLGQEGQQTGAARTAMRARRQALFRAVARDLWRWRCDHQAYLSQHLDVRADILVQGMVFFDLAGDVDNLRIWYAAAKGAVFALIESNAEPKTFWGQPADAFLKIVRARGGVDEQTARNWYFEIGRSG
jgi:hypothetical protein